MTALVEQINWREQFALLEPYMDASGGVIRVRYRARSGHLAFITTLTNVFEDSAWNGPVGSARIDATVSTTRLPGDICGEILRRAGLAEQPRLKTQGAKVIGDLIRNVRAGRDVNVQISLNGADDFVRPSSRKEVERFTGQMKKFTARGRFMIILMDDPENGNRAFWSDVWDRGLRELQGVLVIEFQDLGVADRRTCHERPGDSLVLELPESYGAAESEAAREDLEELLRKRGAGQVSAGVALGLVSAHRHDVGEFHSAVGTVLMDQAIVRLGGR